MNYFDLLDDWTILRIARNGDEISRYLMTGFRASCRRMRGLIGVPDPIGVNKLMRRCARLGNKDGVILAHAQGANNFKEMMFNAALGGWCELCELAREWGTRNFRQLSSISKYSGCDVLLPIVGKLRKRHLSGLAFICSYNPEECARRLCRLANKWGIADRDFNLMLVGTARGSGSNSRELCELAREWGARDFDGMLINAARGSCSNARELCELAREWGADDFDLMLYYAARGSGSNSRELCELAREWGARDFDKMIFGAIRGAHKNTLELCKLACEWGARDFGNMVYFASQRGIREVCEFAREWGICNFNEMLAGATDGGWRELCELAREWGARDFDRMKYIAKMGTHTNSRELYKLASTWKHIAVYGW